MQRTVPTFAAQGRELPAGNGQWRDKDERRQKQRPVWPATQLRAAAHALHGAPRAPPEPPRTPRCREALGLAGGPFAATSPGSRLLTPPNLHTRLSSDVSPPSVTRRPAASAPRRWARAAGGPSLPCLSVRPRLPLRSSLSLGVGWGIARLSPRTQGLPVQAGPSVTRFHSPSPRPGPDRRGLRPRSSTRRPTPFAPSPPVTAHRKPRSRLT